MSRLRSWAAAICPRSASSCSCPATRTVCQQLVLRVGVALTCAVVQQFDYGFAENGLTAYRLGQQLPSQSFINWLGEDKYKKLVKYILNYISQLDIPVMRYVSIYFLSDQWYIR